jgi:hypothetical protein
MFLLPQGYQAELVAVFEPGQIISGLTALGSVYPEGTPMLLRIAAQTPAPSDIQERIQDFNNTVVGLTPLMNPIARYEADENAVYINYLSRPGDVAALEAAMQPQIAWWGLLLLGIGSFFVLSPIISGIAQIAEMMMSMVMMFVMMYMMTGMMKNMQPDNTAAARIHDKQTDMIRGAKKYLGLAVSKGKDFAVQHAPEAREAYEDIKRAAARGEKWAKDGISRLRNKDTKDIIDEDIYPATY